MSGQSDEIDYRPGDKALIRFLDGEWRPAELSPGFIWATPDGTHWLAAEGGFDARPLLTTVGTPEGHPCGHAERSPGCGGCDPGAIEFVITDDGERRLFDITRDMSVPSATSTPEEA